MDDFEYVPKFMQILEFDDGYLLFVYSEDCLGVEDLNKYVSLHGGILSEQTYYQKFGVIKL